jgi:hypothetical protein
MKLKHLLNISACALLSLPQITLAQGPPIGAAANFALFTTIGAVDISGISQLTGDIGTNSGSTTVFVNVNGNIHDQDGASALCAANLFSLYSQLNSTIPTDTISPLLGNGDTLVAGVYFIPAATTLDLNLTLNAEGNPNAVFIFKVEGTLSTGTNSKVKLINSALACNVFWKVEGAISMASGSTMRGNLIANNAAIDIGVGDTLEGRAMSTSGAILVNGAMVYTPTGCGSAVHNGPTAPNLGVAACYAVFSADGPVTNAGITTVKGDVGTNVGLTLGYDSLLINGTLHLIPDTSTAHCAADLLNASIYLNALTADIELRVPAQFGRNLVLTPHTYIMNGATMLHDTLYLNGEGNPNAVFVIQVFGAFETTVNSKIVLTNGTQAKNVYWEVNGAVSINDYSIFNGTIIANNGAVSLTTGVQLYGRAMSTTGAIQTAADSIVSFLVCNPVGIVSHNSKNETNAVLIYPNPFTTTISIVLNEEVLSNKSSIKIYNALGAEVLSTDITKSVTTIDTINLPAGIYFYRAITNNKTIQSGRLIAE